jgi:hypothetical protein
MKFIGNQDMKKFMCVALPIAALHRLSDLISVISTSLKQCLFCAINGRTVFSIVTIPVILRSIHPTFNNPIVIIYGKDTRIHPVSVYSME